MKTAKVLEIVWVNERTKWEHWPIFYITMKMDNNELITLWKKNKDSFKVGDTISYEVVEEWRKWKEVKDNQFRKPYNPEATNRWAMIWMAYKLAFELTYKWDNDFQNAVVLANRIFECAMDTYNLKNDLKEKNEEQESAKDDKLPF